MFHGAVKTVDQCVRCKTFRKVSNMFTIPFKLFNVRLRLVLVGISLASQHFYLKTSHQNIPRGIFEDPREKRGPLRISTPSRGIAPYEFHSTVIFRYTFRKSYLQMSSIDRLMMSNFSSSLISSS